MKYKKGLKYICNLELEVLPCLSYFFINKRGTFAKMQHCLLMK